MKPTFFSTLSSNHDLLQPSETLINTAVSVLKNQRSKSRWNQLRSLYPNGFTPSEFSNITLQLRNNPRLSLNFFNFTLTHKLCSHNLLSLCTIIHTLARSRLKPQTLALIEYAFRAPFWTNFDGLESKPLLLFESLVKTFRVCDSAPFVFDLLIKSCLNSSKIDDCIEIICMLRSRGIYPNVSTCNVVVKSVSRIKGCEAGYEVFREVFGLDCEDNDNVGRLKVSPNAETYNVLMSSFYKDSLVDRVKEVWNEMVESNCEPNCYSYCLLMAAYNELGMSNEVEKLWEEMKCKGIKPDVIAYNTLIGGFCSIGEVKRAEEAYREMELSGIKSCSVTYEHLITGYCRIGDLDSANLLYIDACRKHFRPEGSVVDAVIRGLCDANMVSKGLDFMRCATRHGDFVPGGKCYELLIKGFCKEGKMEEALKLQKEMVGKGYVPNVEIYGAFIDGYMKLGNMELVGKLRHEMLESQMQDEKKD
ncbi:Pentatricopeptide repeat [Dillenia turbinata]|uniref:Pentatricopeptide repeat n=1 Tax=Dillenia turbinata TaxID=194707 RepID=A0AAN8UJE7_9MAGN